MSRHTLAVSELTHPIDPSNTAGAPPEGEQVQQVAAPAPAGPVSFVKNLHPREKITFEDGEVFAWPSQAFQTQDPKLIAQIRAVAAKYHIVEK